MTEWVAKARWAALRGDFAAAGDLYRLSGNLRRALAMYRKGRHHRSAGEVALQLGDHAAASREFEHGGMVLEAAEQAVRAGDRERAARLFVAAGQPRRAAQIQEEGGRPGAAAAMYEHAGDLPRAARLFVEAREPSGAARVIDTLLKGGAGPQDLRELQTVMVRCGQLFLAAGEPGEAARFLERAQRPAEAARAWERAGKPRHAIRAWLTAGEPERAASVAESQPPEAVDPALAAEAFSAAGRHAEAAALFLEAGRPSDAAAALEKLGCSAEAAWAHEAAGDLPAAAASLERAGRPQEAAALFRTVGLSRDAARCFEAAGDLDRAAQCWLDAGDRLRAAGLKERTGDIDGAVEILQSGTVDPDQMFLRAVLLGRLFERKGLDTLAAEQYRQALATEPDRDRALDVLYRLAGALERTARLRDATIVLRRLVSIDLGYKDAARRLEKLEAQRASAAGAAGDGHGRHGLGNARMASTERYVVQEPLADRSPGSAFVARDEAMQRAVVLRRYGPDLVHGERAAERLLADMRRIARLHHPAIAAVHDAGRDGSGVYVVEEHVPGRTLRDILAQDGPLDVPQAVQVVTRLAEALDYAHGLGLLARTLRPDTVVVSASGEARLVDFGLALRSAEGAAPPPPYRPPEADRKERMDPSSDLYLLGVIAWEMLTGSPPPPPLDARAPAPELPVIDDRPFPDLVRRVVSGCLEPDRSKRIGSAQKLLEDLHGTHLLPGALLANRYEILRELGRGGMGTVFAARDLVLDEPVALKVLSGSLDENLEKRFIQEIRLARQINHPNVVRVHTFERWRELRFIVMEYIDGTDLRKWAAARHPIPLGQALDIVAGVAGGLAAAHRIGIVHRDVKPENVLLDADGRPRLVDFGIARKGDVRLTREGLVMGSPAYMAPEQIKGEASDQRADVYALGILSYFLLAGREPFASENVAEVLRCQLDTPPPRLASARPVPATVEDLVMRTLAKDPSRRTASIFEFLEELTRVRGSLTVVTA